MTSVPVKDVGSLLNFVGSGTISTSGIRTGGMDSFGDVMSKASGGGKEQSPAQKVEAPKEKDLKDTQVEKPSPKRESLKAKDSGRDVRSQQAAGEEQQQAVEQAGRQLAEDTAKQLDVSPEKVEAAMEQLGLGYGALLDPQNLTKLVLTLSGEESPLALLTDESLYGTLQKLLDSLNVWKADLAEQLSLTGEELDSIIETMEVPEMSEQEVAETVTDFADMSAEEKEPAKITVTVEQSTETVKLTADEKGNVVQVEETISKETEKPHAKEQGSGQRHGGEEGSQRGGFQTGNPLLDNLLQNRAQAAEVSFESTASFMTAESQEIMDQILDYMKIQLKPEMNQLEMQLHPESLGTLHIQIVSRGNEVTAQFHVQNEAVKAAIEGQLVELKEALREQGIKVEAVEVNVQSNAFESALWQGQGQDADAYEDRGRKPSSRRSINLEALEEDFEQEADQEEKLTAEMMRANGQTVDYTA